MRDQEFAVFHYPAVRDFTADTGRISQTKHYVRSLLEVDVTETLQRLKQMRAPGKKVSFLAWFIKLLADTTAQHPPINGVRKSRHTIWVPKEVNIATVVEKEVNGAPVPLPLLLIDVNHKTVFQLNDEIQAAVNQAVKNTGNLVLGNYKDKFLLTLGAAAPQWLRLFIMRTFILNNPRKVQETMGTVMVTSLGSLGQISGWILPTSMHPLSIGIGTINKRESFIDGALQKRNILHLTIAFDHDVIDGMPALKFVEELVHKMESAQGLGEN